MRAVAHHISQAHGREHTIFRAAPQRPLLLLFSDVMGVKDVDVARARCLFDEFEGQVSTCCVDLYGKNLTPAQRNDRVKNIGLAFDVMNSLLADPVKWRSVLQDAFEGIREYAQATHVGALGFCFGGSCAIELVRQGLPVKAVVSFHGTLDAKPLRGFTGKPPPPVVSHVVNKHTHNVKIIVATGAADPLVPKDMVARFEDEVAQVPGLQLTVMSFKDTTHAFTTFMPEKMANANTAFNPRAARASWVSAIDLFREVLDVPVKVPSPSSRMWVNDLHFEKTAKL